VENQQRQTILLVDDEPQVVKLVRSMLANNYCVLGATGAEEAMEAANAHPDPIDLLLTDIVMPGSNGRELARRLESARPGLRVLYMSGFMAEALLKYHGIAIEGIPFLQKPFTRETLLRKVRAVLDAPLSAAAR
jgi:two-component system cell cycle sensor histidine kinase/response regulator CckA